MLVACLAAAVSAGIDGAGPRAALEFGAAAAELGAGRGFWVASADVAARIRWAIDAADPARPDASLDRIASLIGTSLASQESVPAAFGIVATFPDDPWAVVTAAASLGGDSDTVAAIAGAIVGAAHGVEVFPPDARAVVIGVNHLDLGPVADALLELR